MIHCAVCHLVKKCGMRSLRKRGTPNSHRERETGIEPATPSLARRCSTAEPLAQIYRFLPVFFTVCSVRAGDGNRTHVSSLEGWCSTIELHPHVFVTIGVTGFEPAASWSQTRRSSQTEPHPALLSFSVFPERKIKYTPVFPKCQHLFIKISKKILRPPEGLFPSRYRRACGLPGGDKTGCPD